ncbi:hypothetical protein SAMN06265360_10667 [Haloechinothrix alba]|uniref:HTH cro/C1-type domain-containing protein n=1 Tax=Haloechinothrix alba TaxID=664784 RepID=A0A238WDX5_9PSEU|nr:helix-turn-helix transcriptional regulator [Haloechinothrix alba]SNR44638.1 hypothetical protein SAMN06265360_10667 [Haloechinothrix alba]
MAQMTVTARDHALLRALIARHSYRALAEEVGCSHATIGYLAKQPKRRVALELAGRLESALGARPGDLFTFNADGNAAAYAAKGANDG